MIPQHAFITEMFGGDCLIRYSPSHYWRKHPMKIEDYHVLEPVIARLLQPNELVIDLGDRILEEVGLKKKAITFIQAQEIYPLVRDEARKVIRFLQENNIPFWLGFQGRGFHIHIFFKGQGIPEEYPALRHFKQAIVKWVIDNTGANCCFDVNNKNFCMIRAFGSKHERCMFTAKKCFLYSLPNNYPLGEVQAEKINYEHKKEHWQIPSELVQQFLSVKPEVRSNKYWKNDSVNKFNFIKKLRKARRLIYG